MKMSYRIDRSFPKTVRTRLEDFIESRFEKHSSFVNHISATVVDTNGPRGGVSMRCRLIIRTINASPVVIEETADDIGKAIGRAVERADHAVSRERNHYVAKRKRRQRREILEPVLN